MRDSIDKHIKDSIKVKRWSDKIKNSIKITSCYLTSSEYGNGKNIYLYYVNKSKKTIKYVTFHGYIINSVGDYTDMIDLKSIGPIKSGKNNVDSYYWEDIVYDYHAKNFDIHRIDVEYVDGSKITIQGSGLSLIGLR